MSDGPKKRPQPGTTTKGKQKADEKFARQAAALRANLRRRSQQRRGQKSDDPAGVGQAAGEPDPE